MDLSYTLYELTEAVGGTLSGPGDAGSLKIKEVLTDSRADLGESVFLALAGERLDGHDYLAQAVSQNAAALLIHKPELAETYREQVPVILVEDTEDALRKIARNYRDRLDLTVVAVTGSVGKTSTRDTIAQALADQLTVHRTLDNLNNNFGVPFTILQTPTDADVAVIECGMDRPGKIANASFSSHPDITVITNIGTSHIEKLGSRQAILEAKAEIVEQQKAGGPLILNGEDPYLLKLAQAEVTKRPLIFFTTAGQAGSLRTVLAEDREMPEASQAVLDQLIEQAAAYPGEQRFALPAGTLFRAAAVEESAGGMTFRIYCERPGEEPELLPEVRLTRPGLQQLSNALCALAVTMLVDLDPQRAANALRELRLTSGRQQVEELGEGSLLIDDTYNASPESMRAAFHFTEVLRQNPAYQQSVLVLGGVNELGEYAQELHQSIGRSAGESDFQLYYLLGPWAEALATGIREGAPEAKIRTFTDQALLIKALATEELSRSVILVKASRGYQMEHVCSALRSQLPRSAKRNRERSDTGDSYAG